MDINFKQGFALIIGIGRYHNLRPLNKSCSDARDVSEILTQQCGYPESQVVLLQEDDASKSNISDRLDWLARRANEESTVIIFFSGHGAQRIGGFEPGEYLCPVAADWYNLRGTAISNEEMSSALRAIKARKIVVLLDACHSGGVGKLKDASLRIKAGLSQETYTELSKGEGRILISSCKPDEVSWELENMRNGLFTHYLLDGLRGAAADSDSMVSVLDLFQYVYAGVVEHARKIGKAQTPLLKAEAGDFPIAIVRQKYADDLDKTSINTPKREGEAMGVPDRQKLFICLKSRFLRQDLKQVCFLLGVKWANLSGDATDEKIISLIEYAEARQKTIQLWNSMKQVLPHINCEEVSNG